MNTDSRPAEKNIEAGLSGPESNAQGPVNGLVGETDGVFAPDGRLHQFKKGFVPRPMQREMARAVAEAIQARDTLVAESGTGTGKTFAYLIPVVLSGRRTVVSTGTRYLQEQIVNRDLPQVLSMLGLDLRPALLKGRANYLCRYRHRRAGRQTDLLDQENTIPMEVIDRWAATTQAGDISEVEEVPEQSPFWAQVTSTADNCLGGKCPDYHQCFVNQARKRSMEADIVIVNHHLYFSDLTLKEDGLGQLLPDHDTVVFDEAHSLPEVASVFYGFSVSSFQIIDLVNDIRQAETEDQSGHSFEPVIGPALSALTRLQRCIRDLAPEDEILERVRCREFEARWEALTSACAALQECLETVSDNRMELGLCRARLEQITGRMWDWYDQRDRTRISWMASGPRSFRLHSTPLEVGAHFAQHLQSAVKSWIFSSATLAVNTDFSSFCSKMGLENARTLCWDSPYDFHRNTLLYLPPDMPIPGSPEFPGRLAETIVSVTSVSRGRAFCLFTSHRMMEQVYELVGSKVRSPLIKQGDLPKQHMINRFIETEGAVLFGTTSFWQGVDVPGDFLRCVIIDKLPFQSPSDPVLQSRLQHCEEQGGQPFVEMQIPDAVITLKQGAGRLIRSESDRGVLVICDPRVSTRSYGKTFIDSLPPMPVVRDFARVSDFFGWHRSADTP